MRTSYIPKRGSEIRTSDLKPDSSHAVCVGCQDPVKPGFCRTGSILKGLQFSMRRFKENLPILGTIETPFQTYIIGGEEIEKVKKFGFNCREKGFLCDSCASNYRSVQGQPIVKLDPRPGVIGETLRGAFIPETRDSGKKRPTLTRGVKIYG